MDEKSKLKEQLNEEMLKWQQKIDEAKVQLKLGSMDAKDKIQDHIKEMEIELEVAKLEWKKIDDASNEAWGDIKKGWKTSLDTISEAYDKTLKHFDKK